MWRWWQNLSPLWMYHGHSSLEPKFYEGDRSVKGALIVVRSDMNMCVWFADQGAEDAE